MAEPMMWSDELTPDMLAGIDAELAKAPPRTPERVRRVLRAAGVRVVEPVDEEPE
jgi:hypothetical protein